VVYNINSLSSYSSRQLSSGTSYFGYKQFKRYYPGNYSINFSSALSGINDFKVKSYTNFYLTNNCKLSDIVDYDNARLKAIDVFGYIKYGSEFLSYSDISSRPYALINRYNDHKDYGVGIFTNEQSEFTDFTFKVDDNNYCNIFYTKNYIKYYMCMDNELNIVFVKETLLDFSPSIDAQDFKYLYSERNNYIILIKETETGNYLITKSGNGLKAIPVLEDDFASYLSNPFKLSKSLYIDPKTSLNFNSITYNDENNVDVDKSEFGLNNNYLIYRNYSSNNEIDNILILKNQLLSNDVSSAGNNLISSKDYSSYTNDLRNYTSIAENVKEEESTDLVLNYVFYNQYYNILPGFNDFISPSSMNPFECININDTKFVDSGSFSYTTPEYADKVYHLSDDVTLNQNGQHLLCTWLSGSPFSDEKIWIDRYYYPDLIEKADALSSSPIFDSTYEDYIEKLIDQNYNGIRDNVSKKKIFDKVSDLSFRPNQKYRYERINLQNYSNTLEKSVTSPCYTTLTNSDTTNYFKNINQSGELTLSFNFLGDSSDWIIESDRNSINGGLKITKSGDGISIELNLYDATTFGLSGQWYNRLITSKYTKLKNNFICVSVDTKKNPGYFFLNDKIIDNFTIPNYQFLIKKILFGDFYFRIGNEESNLLTPNTKISNLNISDKYTEPSLAFTSYLLNNKTVIDPIVITLPSGMRNNCDDIDLLQSICDSSSFKSNSVNVLVKNLNISNGDILNDLDNHIRNNIKSHIPANVDINNIEFVNFK